MIHVDSVSVTAETASLHRTALSNVNLAIGDGNLVVVLGPGGFEKSMLLNVIGGLLSPTSGEVSLDGEPIKSPAAARHVVFHDEALLPWHNVEQSVEHSLRRAGVPQKALPQRTAALLASTELTGHANEPLWRMPDNLRLRVALAHSLAAGPRFLLLDDPFRALEISARHEMQEYLLRIWKHYGTGMLIATPDVAEGLFMATDLVLMTGDPVHIESVRRLDYGRRALAGESPRAIRNDPSFKRLHDDIEAEFFANPRRARSNKLIDRPGELR